jgi:ATP synthase protein I
VLKGTLISLRIQSLTAVSLALLSLLAGPVAAYSSLFGSLAVLVPSLLFAVIVLRKLGGDSAAFLGTAVLAEFGKLVLTGLLCAAVFIWVKPLAAGFFFLGMIGALIANFGHTFRVGALKQPPTGKGSRNHSGLDRIWGRNRNGWRQRKHHTR